MIYNNEDISNTKYYQYVMGVLSGSIVAGKYIKQACNRFMNFLNSPDKIFMPHKVERVIKFVSKLKHFQGKTAGKRFILEPWQEWIAASVFGFYQYYINDNGIQELNRMTSTVMIEMSRKNGKTALLAAFGLYSLIYDNEQAAEVILAATTTEQARIALTLCKGFSKSLDSTGKYLRIMRNSVIYKKTSSILKVISSDAMKNDGFNASCGIVDEMHAHPTTGVYDIIKSSMGFRKQPIMWAITTAGFHKEYPFYRMRETGIDILKGLKTNDTEFIALYELDDDDDWKDENVWIKSNPNLGITVTKKFIKEQITDAINDPQQEISVRTKTLCQWCDTAEVWISSDYIRDSMIDNNGNPLIIDFKKFSNQLCWIGTDLASISDLTVNAFVFYNEAENIFYVKPFYWLPEESLKSVPNKEYYAEMKREGYLYTTPGNTVDYNAITTNILKSQYDNDLSIQAVLYDKWNATSWAQEATRQGLNLIPYSQSLSSFSAPTKEVERLLLSKRLKIEYNPITQWMFTNVTLVRDSNDNIKPDKASASNKIDGVIAIIQAIGGAMSDEVGNPEIFSITK